MKINDFLNYYNVDSWVESDRLEWKLTSRESKEIVQTLAAFANTRGGVVVVGVKDDGAVIGQDVSDATVREITQTVLANTAERLYPVIERSTLQEKSVLVIAVTESPLRPHVAYGRPYKRVGTSNVAMDQSEYHLLLGQKKNGGGADRDLCHGAVLADLDHATIEAFVNRANTTRNMNLPVFADTLQTLESLELLQSSALTKGAVLLFGKNPQKFLPNSELRVALFSDNRRDKFLSQKVFGGTLFDQLNGGLGFLKESLGVGIDTGKEGNRLTAGSALGNIPISVFQELLCNALVHRDYHDPSPSYLNIVAQEEIEIMNSGLLPSPKITPETIHLPHPSVPVNRRLARVFFLGGLIEQWGEGTRRVWRQVQEAGLPPPQWESARGIVRVVIRPS